MSKGEEQVVSGALRKTMIYLGLAEDDDRYAAYDDFEEDEYVPAVEEEREEERRAPVTPIGRGQMARVVPSQSGARTTRRKPSGRTSGQARP
jgi:cell division inhibitor SepF